MHSSTKYYTYLVFTIAVFFIASKFVFDKVHDTIYNVSDELLHVSQGLAFCKRNYTYWDSQINKLPGLHLVSTAFLGSYLKCNLYNLKFINLIASVMNLLLFASILNVIYCGNNQPLKTLLQALNLAILPPLCFVSHIYYADTLSLTHLLIYSRLYFMKPYKNTILLIGLLSSVLIRQTIIVWVVIYGQKILHLLIHTSRVFGNGYLYKFMYRSNYIIDKAIDSSKLKKYYSLKDVYVALKYHLSTSFATFLEYLTVQDWLVLSMHGTILSSFTTFMCSKGSIVLENTQAHEAIVLVPQMFYFLIFYGIYGLPYVIFQLKGTIKLIFGNKLKIFILAFILLVIVHYNTLSHPNVLPDHRNYTLYLWKHWYNKYASVPIYIFLLNNLYANLKHQTCISFMLPYLICVFIEMSLQKSIEIRYFLIPYIILRLQFKPSLWLIFGEFVWYMILNAVTYNLYFTKDIMWGLYRF